MFYSCSNAEAKLYYGLVRLALRIRYLMFLENGLLKTLGVFCGSRLGMRENYSLCAKALGEHMAAGGIRLVYGGGRTGLMGILADSVLENNGTVTGIIPEFLCRSEVVHPDLTELKVVENMHLRKKLMYDLSDAFTILPGGLGTLDEAIEVINWANLGLHRKSIILLDVDGYWSLFCDLLSNFDAEGFSDVERRKLYTVLDDPERVLEELR